MATTQILYIETSLPLGVTIPEYRRLRPQRATFWKRIKALAGS